LTLSGVVNPPPEPIRANAALFEPSEISAEDMRLGVNPEQFRDGLFTPTDARTEGAEHVILGRPTRCYESP
jgi:hypothetical protein